MEFNQARFKHIAHTLLRFALGAIFIFHGISKFQSGPDYASMFNVHIYQIYGLGVIEVLAGFFIVAGGYFLVEAFTRIAGCIIAVIMGAAIMFVHFGQWSFMPTVTHPMGGMEFQFLILCLGIYFAMVGNTEEIV